MLRRALPCALALVVAAPGCATSKGRRAAPRPTVITPDDGIAASAKDQDLSNGGERRGVLEYSLGGLTAALSVTLIAFGSVQLHRGIKLRERCSSYEYASSSECFAPVGSPPTNYLASGGLSLAFSLPMAIASGFLFRRAVRIHRDYKTWKRAQVAVSPWVGQGGGLSLSLRF
ncbi:MAG: hypothetical protein KC636_21470 [Myxococcales bacterium]|nr:hypothetical protein [Myxococcales bacterium]